MKGKLKLERTSHCYRALGHRDAGQTRESGRTNQLEPRSDRTCQHDGTSPTARIAKANQATGILWTVLIVGGPVTTLSSCLFGTDNFKLPPSGILALTSPALALVAIADIDRPFRGADACKPLGIRSRHLHKNPKPDSNDVASRTD